MNWEAPVCSTWVWVNRLLGQIGTCVRVCVCASVSECVSVRECVAASLCLWKGDQ